MCFEKLIDVPKIRKFTNSQGKAVFVAVNNTAEAFESDLDDWGQNNWSVFNLY